MNIRRIAASATLTLAMLVTALPAHASPQSATEATVGVTGVTGEPGRELDWPWGLLTAVSDWPWGGPGTGGSSPE